MSKYFWKTFLKDNFILNVIDKNLNINLLKGYTTIMKIEYYLKLNFKKLKYLKSTQRYIYLMKIIIFKF